MKVRQDKYYIYTSGRNPFTFTYHEVYIREGWTKGKVDGMKILSAFRICMILKAV